MFQIENYYAFIKKSLHNIVILESQFSVQQSCLKSKQKNDVCLYTDFAHKKTDKGVQTEDYLDLICGGRFDFEKYCSSFPKAYKHIEDLYKTTFSRAKLVEYDVDSDDSDDIDGGNENHTNDLDSVILNKETNIDVIQTNGRNIPKICENVLPKRKSKIPKKVEHLVQDEIIDVHTDVEASIFKPENVKSQVSNLKIKKLSYAQFINS